MIRYLAFTGGLEVEKVKASLQEPTFQTHSDCRVFQLTRKRRSGDQVYCLEDIRESNAKSFTRIGDIRHFSEPKSISQSSIQNIPLKNWT